MWELDFLAVFGGVKSRFFFFFKVLGCLSPSTWLKGLRFVGALSEGSVQPPLFLSCFLSVETVISFEVWYTETKRKAKNSLLRHSLNPEILSCSDFFPLFRIFVILYIMCRVFSCT